MGVSIYSSWGYPNVVVMAPALTEAGQSQNFQTLSATLRRLFESCEVSPDLGPINTKLEARNHPDRIIRDQLASNVLSKLLNDKFSLVTANHKTNTNGVLESSDNGRVPSYEKHKVATALSMNSNAPMGDQSDNMGLLKSNNSPNIGNANYPRDKTLPSDMDQFVTNLEESINDGNTVFAPPNVEELLQVINSMGGTCENTEVQSEIPNDGADPEGMFPLSGTDLASFEGDLLDDVEMMTNLVDLQESGLDMKEALTKEKNEEVGKKQFGIERKCDRLHRRLKKLASRSVGKQVSEELIGLLEQAHRLFKSSLDIKEENRKERKIKGVSEASLVVLMKKFTTSVQTQAARKVKTNLGRKYFGAGSTDNHECYANSTVLSKLSTDEAKHVETVSHKLHTYMHVMQKQLDSDVTCSSSEGESCDEMTSYNNQHQSPHPISKRALWRWLQQRGCVASRWTWISAQISDLEYKLRLHSDYHKQIRGSKGAVTLSEPQPQPSVSVNGYHGALPGGIPININKEEPLLNGTVPVVPTTACDQLSTCARTRAFTLSLFRKRKLLHMEGLHLFSKKAARTVTIRCNCQVGLTSCAVCTGRADPTQPQERAEMLRVPDRVALVDSCFHPVLSFISDTTQPLHLDSIMQLHDWQVRANQHSLKHNQYSTNKDKEVRSDRRPRLKKKFKLEQHEKLRKIRKQTAAVLSAKLKKKLSVNQRKRREMKSINRLPLLKIKKAGKHSSMYDLDLSEEDTDHYISNLSSELPSRSRRPSPVSSPSGRDLPTQSRAADRRATGSYVSDAPRRVGRDDDSYNIDNIVIPYSMAASTRVERLQYKEILTPKWRMIEPNTLATTVKPTKNNGDLKSSHDSHVSHGESDLEDTSDDVYLERHTRCEELEKKKFMSYIKLPLAVRGRANRRTDSRAESSGANTPDPMSPCNTEQCEPAPTATSVSCSPLTTPPATPLSVTEEQSTLSNTSCNRRRTVSSSRPHSQRDKQETPIDRCSTPDSYVEVAPYEPKIYPLSDDVYDRLLRENPQDYPRVSPVSRALKKIGGIASEFVVTNNPGSPSTSSTVSALEDDPNDPEWTIVENRDGREDMDLRNRYKRN